MSFSCMCCYNFDKLKKTEKNNYVISFQLYFWCKSLRFWFCMQSSSSNEHSPSLTKPTRPIGTKLFLALWRILCHARSADVDFSAVSQSTQALPNDARCTYNLFYILCSTKEQHIWWPFKLPLNIFNLPIDFHNPKLNFPNIGIGDTNRPSHPHFCMFDSRVQKFKYRMWSLCSLKQKGETETLCQQHDTIPQTAYEFDHNFCWNEDRQVPCSLSREPLCYAILFGVSDSITSCSL